MVGFKRSLLRSGEENDLRQTPVRESNGKKSPQTATNHITFLGLGEKKK